MPLRSSFVLESAESPFAVIWDKKACRVIGVVNLRPAAEAKAESEKDSGSPEEDAYVLKAAGPSVFSANSGSSVFPKYFGVRIEGATPVFLFSHGHLAVEEQLWLEEAGTILKQRFRISNQTGNVKLTFPESYRKRITANKGSWTGNVLSVSKEDAADLVLSYQLKEPTS